MGWQHPGENGQWPHLDQLWAHPNIDLVAFDNYLPLSDWTTGGGGLDVANWTAPAPSGSWPPSPATMNGLGLSGVPSIYSIALPQGQHRGRGILQLVLRRRGERRPRPRPERFRPAWCPLPQGDRLAQARNPYFAEPADPRQQAVPLVVEQHASGGLRHRARLGRRRGRRPSGSPQSKSIVIPRIRLRGDRPRDQSAERLLRRRSRRESATPYWSIWDPAPGLAYLPRRDDTIAALALAGDLRVLEHGRPQRDLEAPASPMIQFAFSCVWNWDARPFPVFPNRQFGLGRHGQLASRRLVERSASAVAAAGADASAVARDLSDLSGASDARMVGSHQAEVRRPTSPSMSPAARLAGARYAVAYFRPRIDLSRSCAPARPISNCRRSPGSSLRCSGEAKPFWVAPPGLSAASGQAIGTGDGATTSFPLLATIGGATRPGVRDARASPRSISTASRRRRDGPSSADYAPAVTFATAPGGGVSVTADFGVLWLCRFADDVQDLEEFMAQLWLLKTLRLTTVRP